MFRLRMTFRGLHESCLLRLRVKSPTSRKVREKWGTRFCGAASKQQSLPWACRRVPRLRFRFASRIEILRSE